METRFGRASAVALRSVTLGLHLRLRAISEGGIYKPTIRFVTALCFVLVAATCVVPWAGVMM